jgi:hypothetical protein
LKKYFNDLKMESDIRSITAKKNVLKNFTDKYSEYNIVNINETKKQLNNLVTETDRFL